MIKLRGRKLVSSQLIAEMIIGKVEHHPVPQHHK